MDEISYVFDKLVETIGGPILNYENLCKVLFFNVSNIISYPVYNENQYNLVSIYKNFNFTFTPSTENCDNLLSLSLEYKSRKLFKTDNQNDMNKVTFFAYSKEHSQLVRMSIIFQYIFMS